MPTVGEMAALFEEYEEEQEQALYVVASDIDNDFHGPFSNREEALDFAEDADGSVFEWNMREI